MIAEKYKIISFKENGDERGKLVVVEGTKDMYDFSPDSILLVLSSEHYNTTEYIRDFNEFLREVSKNA